MKEDPKKTPSDGLREAATQREWKNGRSHRHRRGIFWVQPLPFPSRHASDAVIIHPANLMSSSTHRTRHHRPPTKPDVIVHPANLMSSSILQTWCHHPPYKHDVIVHPTNVMSSSTQQTWCHRLSCKVDVMVHPVTIEVSRNVTQVVNFIVQLLVIGYGNRTNKTLMGGIKLRSREDILQLTICGE